MKNGKVAAVITVLKKHGISITNDIALELLAASETRESAEYEPGDFVEVYDGLGECSFGEVIRKISNGYSVMMWDESKEEYTYMRDTSAVSNISSKEEAREYYLARSGQT